MRGRQALARRQDTGARRNARASSSRASSLDPVPVARSPTSSRGTAVTMPEHPRVAPRSGRDRLRPRVGAHGRVEDQPAGEADEHPAGRDRASDAPGPCARSASSRASDAASRTVPSSSTARSATSAGGDTGLEQVGGRDRAGAGRPRARGRGRAGQVRAWSPPPGGAREVPREGHQVVVGGHGVDVVVARHRLDPVPVRRRDLQDEAAPAARRLQGACREVAHVSPCRPVHGRNIVVTPESEMTATCVGPVAVGGHRRRPGGCARAGPAGTRCRRRCGRRPPGARRRRRG